MRSTKPIQQDETANKNGERNPEMKVSGDAMKQAAWAFGLVG